MPIEALSPRILSLKSRQDQLTAAREEAESQLEQRRAELPTSKEIKGYVADFREFLQEGTFPERKALIRNFVQGIEIVGGRGNSDVHHPHAVGRGDLGSRPRFLILSSPAHRSGLEPNPARVRKPFSPNPPMDGVWGGLLKKQKGAPLNLG